jgi:GTP-binding protein
VTSTSLRIPAVWLAVFCIWMQLTVPAIAFVPTAALISHTRPMPSLSLLLAKRGSGPNAGEGSKKKKPVKSSASTKRDKAPPGKTTRAQVANSQKKQSSGAPPWQIVSKKDMKKKVEAEKKRRELAQQGIHNSPELEQIDISVSSDFLDPVDKSFLAWKRYSPSPNHEVEFIGAYLDKRLPPRLGAPEVAFLGRSNVGKSSLLNKLVASESARVGKTPGATASVNLYGIYRNEKAILGLVDLPGFGYAKLSKENKESVQLAAENYLAKRKELVLGILLVDIRREPSDDDRAVLAALYDKGLPIVVVATKVDKMSKVELEPALEAIRMGLGLPEGQPLCVSSVTGQGIKDMWQIIMEACEAGVEEYRGKLRRGGQAEKRKSAFSDEDDDVAYNQGYDWIHDSDIMYEGSEEDYDISEDDDEEEYEEEPDNALDKRESLKSLKKMAKDMERRGEV